MVFIFFNFKGPIGFIHKTKFYIIIYNFDYNPEWLTLQFLTLQYLWSSISILNLKLWPYNCGRFLLQIRRAFCHKTGIVTLSLHTLFTNFHGRLALSFLEFFLYAFLALQKIFLYFTECHWLNNLYFHCS